MDAKTRLSSGFLGSRSLETGCDDVASGERSECDRHRPGEKISAKQRRTTSHDATVVRNDSRRLSRQLEPVACCGRMRAVDRVRERCEPAIRTRAGAI